MRNSVSEHPCSVQYGFQYKKENSGGLLKCEFLELKGK